MKTAISIPDKLFKEAEITAKQMGLARSQLYVRAIKEFIDHHNREYITKRLNEVYASQKVDSDDLHIGLNALREATKDDTW